MSTFTTNRQPWIFSPSADLLLIAGPAFFSVLGAWFLTEGGMQSVSPWGWLVLVAGIDVAHVYSTLWRTYLDPSERSKYGQLLLFIPFGAYFVGTLLYTLDGILFWRALAYLAVFHFVRQQYGFMSLYARHESRPRWERNLDAATIYMAMLFPLLHWHTDLPRPYQWFLEGDFIPLPWSWLGLVSGILFGLLALVYTVKEVRKLGIGQPFNWPKNLIVAGTALSWITGIVVLEGDLAFTLTNVVSHGIPYIALVWMYGRKKTAGKDHSGVTKYFRPRYLAVFIGFLLAMAYLEEGLWDAWIWREHTDLFPVFNAILPALTDPAWVTLLVPLLAVPQITHYALDGFIWKIRRPDGDLRNI